MQKCKMQKNANIPYGRFICSKSHNIFNLYDDKNVFFKVNIRMCNKEKTPFFSMANSESEN